MLRSIVFRQPYSPACALIQWHACLEGYLDDTIHFGSGVKCRVMYIGIRVTRVIYWSATLDHGSWYTSHNNNWLDLVHWPTDVTISFVADHQWTQATSTKQQAWQDIPDNIWLGHMRVRKKLVKEIKKTNPDLADEIKYMSVKDFKMLMFVFNVWCRL